MLQSWIQFKCPSGNKENTHLPAQKFNFQAGKFLSFAYSSLWNTLQLLLSPLFDSKYQIHNIWIKNTPQRNGLYHCTSSDKPISWTAQLDGAFETPDEFGMISLPIINAFISAGAFTTQSVLCRIIKDELLEVYLWSLNIWFRGLQAPFSKTNLVLWALGPCAEHFQLHPLQEEIPHTQRGNGRVGTSICGRRSGREDQLRAINKKDCKPQNKQISTAGMSIWPKPLPHFCPKVRV